MTNRLKKELRTSKTLPEDVIQAVDELLELIKYYENEIKQMGYENRRKETPEDVFQWNRGAISAYRDHVHEMHHIVEILRGDE